MRTPGIPVADGGRRDHQPRQGNDNTRLQEIISQLDAGEIGSAHHPVRLHRGRQSVSASGGFRVKDLQGARDAVDWYAQHDYHQIKIYNSFHPEWCRDRAYAHRTACA